MKKLQEGRSMIEMLGVLAIIGVLSVGGLAGYTMAMNRHRANTALDYAQRAFVLIQTWGDGTGSIEEKSCATYMDEEIPAGLSSCTVGRAGPADNSYTTVTIVPKNGKIGFSMAERVGSALPGQSAETYKDAEFVYSDETNSWKIS